jgi:hypothetical protein
MNFTEENENKIDEFIRSHKTIATTNRIVRVELINKIEEMDILRLPLNLLYYNFDNIRSEFQVLELKKELGKELDINIKEHREKYGKLFERIIKGKKSTNLKEDIRKRGQMEHGIINHSGCIINGNRRYTVLKELYLEEKN